MNKLSYIPCFLDVALDHGKCFFALTILCAITQPCLSQMSMDISPMFLSHDKVSLNELTMTVRNSINFKGDVEVQIYRQPFNPDSDALHISQRFNLESKQALFYFEDLFNKSQLQIDENLEGLCIILYDRNGYRPLGMKCVNLIRTQDKTSEKPPSLNNEKQQTRWIDYSGSVGLDMNRTQGEFTDFVNGQDWFYTMDADAELTVAEIPISFKALYSNYDDAYLGYDLNRVTTYFDTQKWRAVLRKKAEGILNKKKEKLFERYPEYNKYKAKYEMANKVLSNKHVEQEITDLGNISDRLKELNISDVEQLMREVELIESQINKIEEMKVQNWTGFDSTTTKLQVEARNKLDSISKVKSQLETEYEELNYLKSLALKSQGYQKITELRDTAQVYLAKGIKIEEGYDAYKKQIINNPTEMYALLKEHGLAEGESEFLSRIDELRLGVIHPNYSELSLRNGQQKGFAFGYGVSKWNVHTFLAKNRTRDIRRKSNDSLHFEQSPVLAGAKLTLKHTENVSNGIFVIRDVSDISGRNQTANSHFGLFQKLNLAEDQQIETEFVWSGNESPDSEGNSSSSAFNKVIKEMAMRANYQGRSTNKKFNYKTEIKYWGPRFLDFNNSFIRRNSLQTRTDGRYRINSDIWCGANASFDFGNVWTSTSPLNTLYGVGLSAGITKSNLPGVQYLVHFAQADYNEVEISTVAHNATIQKTYSIASGNWNSVLNLSMTNSEASVDTLNTAIASVFFSQQIEIPFFITMMISGNYTQISSKNLLQEDWGAEIRIPVQVSKLKMTAGLKWINTDESGNLGWNVNMTWPIHKKVNLSALLDSLWLTSASDQYGQITQQYNANYQLKLKYNL